MPCMQASVWIPGLPGQITCAMMIVVNVIWVEMGVSETMDCKLPGVQAVNGCTTKEIVDRHLAQEHRVSAREKGLVAREVERNLVG